MLPELAGSSDEQPKHDYPYWENGGHAPQAQAARYDDFHAWRESPGHPIELYRIDEDPDLQNDQAADHTEVINIIEQIFAEAHQDREWFITPGESGDSISKKTCAGGTGWLLAAFNTSQHYLHRTSS